MIQLQETMLEHKHAHLLAHGLGAHLIDAWLQHTRQAQRVLSALLIDPLELHGPEHPSELSSWRTIEPTPWPMPLAVLWKERQPSARMSELLQRWGARELQATPVGGGVVSGWALVQAYWPEYEEPQTAQEA